MLSLSLDTQRDVIDAFNDTSRYLDDILNLDNPYFENMKHLIYPPELTLTQANSPDTEAAFLDLYLFISNGKISTKIYDKRDDLSFDIVNYPNLCGDVPRATSYGVYISQLVRFARASTNLTDFHDRNKIITQKLLSQGFRYHKLRRTFTKFFKRYDHVMHKYNTTLKDCLKDGISQPLFYGDAIYKIRKIITSAHFSVLFPKLIRRFCSRGYDPDILRRTASIVVDARTVNHFAHLFNCTMIRK